MLKYTATLTLSVEAEDEAGAKQAFKDKVGAADFDSDSIELEKDAE
ncbi:hypothetical protein ES703_114001 [subsurface metagenome]